MNLFKRFFALAAIALMSVGIFAATQAIEGVVKDDTGAVIPGVNVVLTNTDTGITREALSDESGRYNFSNIKTGTYEIKAELEGFQPVRIAGIKVQIGDELTFPLILKVGQVSNELEITAEVEQVETTTSGLDTVIDEKRITDLPLNGRNPLNLVFLAPGVTTGSQGYASANGSRARGNNYQLDGIDNNDTAVIGNVVDVNVDATAEFRVLTSNPTAEYGRAGGAIIDVITKSGTNEFHGNAFWFHRNDNLDAPTWDENYYGLEKGEFKRNQVGASLSGPIVKNKLFFFFNTEVQRIRQAAPQVSMVPTQAFRDMITNPDMAAIFNTYYPLPNAGNPSQFLNGVAMNGQYAFPYSNPYDSEQYTGKVDYSLNQNHSFYVRYFYNNIVNEDARILPTTDLGRFPSAGHTHSVALDWTWIISPTLVNDLKVGQNRVVFGWSRPETNPVDLAFGFGWADSATYFEDFGGPVGYGDQGRHTGTFEVKDTLTWTRANHNVKFGIDLRFMQDNSDSNFDYYPELYFDSYYGFHSDSTLANIANGAVDYTYQAIYGNGQEFIPGLTDYRGFRSREYDFFVQDDWKVLPNLTLNLGLRYELKPAPYEVNNMLANVGTDIIGNGYHLPNQSNFFDPANFSDGDWVNWYYWLYGMAPTDNANWVGTGSDIYLTTDNRKIYDAPKTNFAPRVGFSWDPFGNGKTAVRGGYGISYDRMYDNLLSWNTSQLPFGMSGIYPAVTGSMTGIWPNASYFGHGTPIPEVTLHPAPGTYASQVVYNTNWKQPYIQTWNISVQHELWPGNILTVAYAGSAGVHMLVRGNPNQMYHPTEELIQAIEDNFGYSNKVPTPVVYGSVQNAQFMRYHYIDTSAHSDYNALQLSFSHRFANGLQFQTNYTWSKAFDDASEAVYTEGGSSPFRSDWYNPAYDRGYSSFDIRHNFNASFIYELPFGPGKMFGGDAEGIMAELLGGWQINGIVYANSGIPLDYKIPVDTLGTGYTNARGPARPNMVTDSVTTDGNLVGPTQANFAWGSDVLNLRNPQGDYYRGFFRGPGYFNVDFSLFKEVKTPWFTAEGAKFQFRVEAFNLFNHTNFNTPSLSLSSSNLGKTFSAAANRQIQLGLKFIF